MSCCPPGSIGATPSPSVLDKKELKGNMMVMTSTSKRPTMPAYVVGAETCHHIVVVFSDVYGIDSGNQKVFCDVLSERMNALVLLPDLFRGKPLLGEDVLSSWLKIPVLVWGCRTRVTDGGIENDLLDIVLPYLVSKKAADTKISLVGFCFGGWVMGRALALDAIADVVTCGVGIHPSWKLQELYGKKETVLATHIKEKPILFLVAGNDDLKVGTPIVQQLSKQRGGMDENKISIEFPDMVHGFVARGDTNDPKIAEQQEKVLGLTIEYINTHA